MKYRICSHFLLVATLAAATAAGSFAGAPPAGAKHHVYVSFASGATEAFPFVDGVPSKTPDRIFPQSDVGPIAVDTAGYVYLYHLTTERVDVFAPGNGPLVRSILFSALHVPPSCNAPFPYSSAVDGRGNLFVGYLISCSPGSKRPLAGSGSAGGRARAELPLDGILAYPPGAHGRAQPSALIDLGQTQASALGTDATGNLYVSTPTGIITYANPASSPSIVRVLLGPALYQLGDLAVDGATNQMYEFNTPYFLNEQVTYITAYATSAIGPEAPDQGLAYSNPPLHPVGQLAVLGDNLYILDNVTGTNAAAVLYSVRKELSSPKKAVVLWSMPGQSSSYMRIGP